MKGFLLLLALAYASADKLDLTYLPPPGSQYSGGRPEDFRVPLEFPKETYSTKFKPNTTPISLEELKPEDYQATIGINRGLPPQNQNVGPGGQIGSVSNIQNQYKVPTTTVSYAFTQTTTHPPSESFETTLSPSNTASGFPVTGPSNEPTFEPGSFYEQNINTQNRPGDSGYQVVDQLGQLQPTNVPRPGNIAQFPSSLTQSQQSDFDQNRPGQPGFSPFNKPSFQGTGSLYEQNINAQNRPDESGYKVVDQFQLQPTNAPHPDSIAQFPGSPAQFQVPVFDQNRLVQSRPNSSNQFQQANKQLSSLAPGFVQNQYSGNQTVLGNISPQRIPTNLQPEITSVIGENVNGPQGFITNQPSKPQGSIIEQQYSQAGLPTSSTQIPPARPQKIGGFATQPYPGYSDYNGDSRDEVLQNTFRPSTTTTPIGSPTSIPDQKYSIGSSVGPNGYYSTPAYPETSQDNVEQTRYRYRPERLQAKSDRNAVILNYDNVITPDGYFAYSYDTSNGIHADESGDANGGVKAKGSYSYTGDDGKVYTVVYTADENGFRPQGSHLPTPPPVPEAIQKIIDRVKQEKEAGIIHDGFYDENKYGHKKLKDSTARRPQTSSGGSLNRNDSSFDNEFGQPNENRQYSTQEGPISTTNDYNTLKQQDGQVYNNDSNNLPKRINQYSPVRQSGLNTDLQDTTSTKQPFNVSTRKQYQEENFPNNRNQENIRRPISIPGSSLFNGLQHQHVDQSTFAEPTESQDQGNIRDYVDNENTRGSNIQGRPITGIDTQNRNNEFDSLKGNLDRPGSRPFHRLDNSSPFEKAFIENAKQSSGKVPFSDDLNEDLPNQRDQYSFDENLTEHTSLMSQPGYGTRPEKETQKYVGQTVSSSRQPGQGGFIVTKPGVKIVNSEYGPETDELPEENTKLDYVPANGFRKILGHKQTPFTSNGEVNVTKQNLPENVRQKVISQQPKTGSITNIDRQSQKQVPVQGNQFSNLENTSVNVPSFNRQNSNGRPSFNQLTGISKNNNFPQVEETGYQYIPPQTKFNHDKKNKNPFRLTGADYTSTTGKPSQSSFYDTKDTTATPFITPNVSRGDKNNSGEEYDEDQFIPGNTDLPQDNIKQNYGGKYDTVRDPQYDQTGTTPDQVSGDEIISSTRLPNYSTTAGSTYRPTLDKTTAKPTQQYTSIPTYNNVGKGTIKPYPSEDDRYYDRKEFNTKSPYNVVTSTTPIPSRTRYFGSTQPNTLVPGSETYFRETNRPVQPNNGFVSSTTPIPQGSHLDGSYPQNMETQYKKIYMPLENIRPTTEYYDRTVGSKLPSRPTGSTITNAPFGYTQEMKYGDRLPSSTYGPVDRNLQLSSTPSLQFDRFGRPINNYQQGSVGDQYQTGPSRDSQGRPVYEDNSRVQYQPTNDLKGYKQQQGSYVPPSTERVVGEDFSGPKQPQYFDSETGYHYK